MTHFVTEDEDNDVNDKSGSGRPEHKLTDKQKQKERYIVAYEKKKSTINKLLTSNFEKLNNANTNNVVDSSCC